MVYLKSIDSDITVAVAFAQGHTEKCMRDQPTMRGELEAGLAHWKQQNLQHVRRAHSHLDYEKVADMARALLEQEGLFTIEHCQQVIDNMHSEDRGIDARIRADEKAGS